MAKALLAGLLMWGVLFPLLAADLAKIRLPPGFHIEVLVEDIPNARSMAIGANGTLFVGSRTAGRVYALSEPDAQGRYRNQQILLDNLNMPNGIALHDGALYLAENHRIIRLPDIESRLDNLPQPELITQLPRETHHGWRYLRFGPDGLLYLSIGAPCNICNKPGFASIVRMRPDGSGREVFAQGVRNSVGFDWHPQSQVLWFTDNGRDWLGDDRIFAWAGKRSLLSGGSGKKGGIGTTIRKCLKPIYYAMGKPRILMQKIVGDSYFIIDDAPEQISVEVAKGILTSDGHCTVSPDQKWILTDGYTDSNNRLPLFLWNLEKACAIELGRFDTPPQLDGPLRVDLHPRFSHDGKTICIDSAMSGTRNMYVLNIEEFTGSRD